MNALIKYRKENSLTQTQLGELLDVKQSVISRVESGSRKFSHKKARDIERRTGGKLSRAALRPDIYGDYGAAKP